LALLSISLLLLAGCRSGPVTQGADDVVIDLSLPNGSPQVGAGALEVSLTTANGAPIADATVVVRGDMTHAGMIPVMATVTPAEVLGNYDVTLEWTMAGDWIVTVTATLADGRGVTRQFPIRVE
jgi:hypothetical protein